MTGLARSRRIVVVGNGMAGCRFVQEALARDPDRRLAITVVGEEPGGAYSRLQLSNVLAGTAPVDGIELAGEQWYAARGVTLLAGTAVTGIERGARRVRLDDGAALGYDILVLATGSSPVLPPIAGLLRDDGGLLPGAVAFRTLEDCETIMRLAADTDSTRGAVVLGAGVLGLEAARGLAGARPAGDAGPARPAADGAPARRRRVAAADQDRPRARRGRARGRRGAGGASGRRQDQEPGIERSRRSRYWPARPLLRHTPPGRARPRGRARGRGRHRGRRRAAQRHRPEHLRRSASAPSIAAGRTGWWRRAGPRPGQRRRSSTGRPNR